jgi:WD40 repeat protein
MNDREFSYDAFISYSRKDLPFARRLHEALRSYRPPRDLPVPQRALRVFRDEEDLSGTELHASLERNLQQAASLIVICSPNSAASGYVAAEIERFAEHRDRQRVIAILLDGIPNNEAKPDESARRAFPEQLIRLLPVPLAADYRGFDVARDKVSKGRFTQAWFKTLADVYAPYGVDRSRIEQREQKRRAERLRNLAVVSSAIAVALIGLTIWALVSRHEATVQRDLATAGQREAEARLAFDASGDGLMKATLLSAASLRSAQTVEGLVTMTRLLALLPRQLEWRRPPLAQHNGSGDHHPALASSIDGSQIAVTELGTEIDWLDARNGKEVNRTSTTCHPSPRPALAFSPSGALLAVGCERQVCLLDASQAAQCRFLSPPSSKYAAMVWAASFSPDSKLLATAGYGSASVTIDDLETAQTELVGGVSGTSVRATAISPDGRWLVAAANQRVRLWRTGHYESPATEVRTAGDVLSIAFEPDGDAFVTAGAELVRWGIVAEGDSPVQLQPQAQLAIKAHTLRPVQWRDRTCLVAAASSAIHLICGEHLTEVLRIPTPSAAAAVSLDGQRLINEQVDGTLAAWQLDGGLEVRRIAVGAAVRSIALALDRSWLAAGSDDGSVTIFDTGTWQQRKRLHVPAAVKKVTRSADGRWLLIHTDAAFHVFDTTTWQKLTAKNYPGTLTSVAFTPEQRLLLVIGNHSVMGFSPGDWREQFELVHDGSIERVAIDATASRIAIATHYAGGHDSGVQLATVTDLASDKRLAWAYTSGSGSFSHDRMLELIAAHHSSATGGDPTLLAQAESWPSIPVRNPYSPKATTAAWTAEASANVISATHAPTQRVLGEWDQQGDVTDLLFLPEDAPRWLVSAGDDGLLRLWPLTADDLISEACARLKSILTPQAWTQLAQPNSNTLSCP